MTHAERVFKIGIACGQLLRASADLCELVNHLQVANSGDAFDLTGAVETLERQIAETIECTRLALNGGQS